MKHAKLLLNLYAGILKALNLAEHWINLTVMGTCMWSLFFKLYLYALFSLDVFSCLLKLVKIVYIPMPYYSDVLDVLFYRKKFKVFSQRLYLMTLKCCVVDRRWWICKLCVPIPCNNAVPSLKPTLVNILKFLTVCL